jgi:predicted site-specific integrase-resolvase
MSATMTMPELLTTEEAAKHITVSTRTLEDWRSDGKGPPYVRCGRRIAYPADDLASRLRSNTVRHGDVGNGGRAA